MESTQTTYIKRDIRSTRVTNIGVSNSECVTIHITNTTRVNSDGNIASVGNSNIKCCIVTISTASCRDIGITKSTSCSNIECEVSSTTATQFRVVNSNCIPNSIGNTAASYGNCRSTRGINTNIKCCSTTITSSSISYVGIATLSTRCICSTNVLGAQKITTTKCIGSTNVSNQSNTTTSSSISSTNCIYSCNNTTTSWISSRDISYIINSTTSDCFSTRNIANSCNSTSTLDISTRLTTNCCNYTTTSKSSTSGNCQVTDITCSSSISSRNVINSCNTSTTSCRCSCDAIDRCNKSTITNTTVITIGCDLIRYLLIGESNNVTRVVNNMILWGKTNCVYRLNCGLFQDCSIKLNVMDSNLSIVFTVLDIADKSQITKLVNGDTTMLD